MEEDEEDRRRQSTSDDQGKNNKTSNFLFHFELQYYHSKKGFFYLHSNIFYEIMECSPNMGKAVQYIWQFRIN
jgi:hypothetical protein